MEIRVDKYVSENPERNERIVRNELLFKVKSLIKKIPFVKDLLAAYFCLTDSQTSIIPKAALGAALAYFVMPIDMVPDIIPFLGFADDGSVLAATIKAVGDSITDKHKDLAIEWLEGVNDEQKLSV